VPTNIKPILSAATAYRCVELPESRMIGEIASSRSALALPA
jgi:hypothetical protein